MLSFRLTNHTIHDIYRIAFRAIPRGEVALCIGENVTTFFLVTAFAMAFIACLMVIIAIPAWVIMILLGALHASGLDGVPAISFTQACLSVSLVAVVFWLLHVATRDY